MGQPFRVNQYHPIVTFGDAISNQMFFLQRSLRDAGIEGNIFTHRAKGLSSEQVRLLPCDEAWNADLFLLHHSSGNPRLKEVLTYEIPRALVYHNITPPEFYSHDPHLQNLCQMGRNQLKLLAEQCIALFADSQFNAQEMAPKTSQLLPLFPIQKGERRADWAPNSPVRLLFVGRIAPHKNQEFLIRVLAHLCANTQRDYRLHLVGSGDRIYLEFLKLTAKRLGMREKVQFSGKVSDEAKKGFYQNSDLYISASLHEGFGVPLVEAMQHSLPVIALERTAVAETLGEGGIRVDRDDPAVFAATIEAVVEHHELAHRLLALQGLRLESLSQFCRSETVVDLMFPLLQSIRKTSSSESAKLENPVT